MLQNYSTLNPLQNQIMNEFQHENLAKSSLESSQEKGQAFSIQQSNETFKKPSLQPTCQKPNTTFQKLPPVPIFSFKFL